MNSKKITIKKGEVLQYKGKLNSKVYVVLKGLLRSYSRDEKGKEHIFMFAPEGWIMGDAVDQTTPTELTIDAIEDSELVVREKDLVRDGTPEGFEGLTRRLLVLQRRILMMMSVSAIERYEQFERTYPQLVQRVPQKMIASYLGITPEGLSKVKAGRLKLK